MESGVMGGQWDNATVEGPEDLGDFTDAHFHVTATGVEGGRWLRADIDQGETFEEEAVCKDSSPDGEDVPRQANEESRAT
jgi:hypothetical protein